MIEVEGPDGTVYEFPDGTPQETMATALRKQYGGLAAPAAAQQPAAPKAPPVIGDMAAAVPSGMVRGAVETASLPVTAARALTAGSDWLADHIMNGARSALGYEPLAPEDTAQGRDRSGTIGATLDKGQDLVRTIIDDHLYEPRTTPGKYAETVGEFLVPGGLPSRATRLATTGGRMALEYGADVARHAVVPALASEAAGQATEGTAYEPAARIAGAVAGNFAGAAGKAAVAPEMIVRRAIGNGDDIDWERAVGLQDNSTGVRLSGPEAIAQAQGGATALPDLLRVVEGSMEGRAATAPFFARRPGQVDTAVQGVLDRINPPSAAPSLLGPRAAEAAERAIAKAPESQAFQDAIFAAGPRTTAMQAGDIIQPALREVFDRREGMRNALADRDYASARSSAPRIDVDGLVPQPTVRAPGYTRLDPATDIHGQAQMAPTAVPANIQTPGLVSNTGPDMIQVDARGALREIDRMRANERGAASTALDTVRGLLFRNGGVDTSVHGLENARNSVNGMIAEAQQAGNRHVVERLIRAREHIDTALETSPEFARANQGFAAASRPLDAFEAPGMEKVIKRDEFNRDFVTPSEQVPDALATPSEARNFNAVAPRDAQVALGNRIATQILDKATDGAGNVSPDRLATALRDGEDLLSQFPDVAKRLNRIVVAGADVPRARLGPIGDIAAAKSTTAAGNATLPQNPMVGSQGETGDAVRRLMAEDPDTTRGVVRQNLADRYSKASTETQGGDGEFVGAKFRKDVAGNQQRRDTLDEVIDAINRPEAREAMPELLDVLQATGRRKPIGSATAFNNTTIGEMSAGGPLSQAFGAARTLGTSLFTTAGDSVRRAAYRNSLSELADMFVDPQSVQRIQRAVATGAPIALPEASARALAQILPLFTRDDARP